MIARAYYAFVHIKDEYDYIEADLRIKSDSGAFEADLVNTPIYEKAKKPGYEYRLQAVDESEYQRGIDSELVYCDGTDKGCALEVLRLMRLGWTCEGWTEADLRKYIKA